MATRLCIWPPLGQSSDSWPFAAITLVSLAQHIGPAFRCRHGTVTAVACRGPLLQVGCQGFRVLRRVAALRRERQVGAAGSGGGRGGGPRATAGGSQRG